MNLNWYKTINICTQTTLCTPLTFEGPSQPYDKSEGYYVFTDGGTNDRDTVFSSVARTRKREIMNGKKFLVQVRRDTGFI